jgi:hypothetical protein
MATYLQGVQDYIPQFQPFQPDLNLYSNVLQTKQTEYDTAWKSLNNVYGQYFYADLTRDSNIQRKDELLKNIDFNLKRISGLDLSLDQNVDKAVQVFKPFYEDEYLMKDMAWTKNYANQRGRAEGLKNSLDEKRRSGYWDGGVRALDYMRQEFKEASDPDSLNFQNAEYTPYVNAQKKAMDLAKEAGLSVESVDFSDDGRWIIKKTNGEQLMEPLAKLFEAQLGSDPAIQAVYKTQAYIDRKDYAESNAGQFGGDKNAAEMKYLEESYTMLKEANQRRYKNMQQTSSEYGKKITDLEQQIRDKKGFPEAEAMLENLKEAKEVNDKIIQRIEDNNEALEEETGTATTSSGFQNPYGDLKSLRWKVDNAMASSLMQKDLNEAAQIFAFRGAKTDIKENVYAVNEQNHQFRMAEVALRNQGIEKAARIRNAGDMQKAAAEYMYDAGIAEPDLRQTIIDADGKVVANPNYMQPIMLPEYENTFTEKTADGSASDSVNVKYLARKKADEQTNAIAIPYISNMLTSMSDLKRDGTFTNDDIKYIFSKTPGMTIEKFNRIIQKGGLTDYLKHTLKPWQLRDVSNRFQMKLTENANVAGVDQHIENNRALRNNFNDYTNYLDDQNTFFKKATTQVEQELKSKGIKGAEFLYDERGRLRTREEFMKISGTYNPHAQMKNLLDKRLDIAKEYAENHGLDWRSQEGKHKAIRAVRNDSRVQDLGKQFDVLRDKTGGYSPYEAGNAWRDYDDVMEAAGEVWRSGRIKERIPGVQGEGAGQFVDTRTSIMVSPKSHSSTAGKRFMGQFINDFQGIDFDNRNSVITFGGASKNAMSTSIANGETDRGKALVNAIFAEIQNGKSEYKNFKLSSQNIAGGNATKGAMIIVPDAKWLKQYLATGEDQNNNLLTAEEYKNALTHGITVISDSSNFKNGLFTSSNMSPLAAQIDYRGSYSEKSPYDKSGNTYFNIEKNSFGTSDYTVSGSMREWNPLTKEYVTIDIPSQSIGTLGNNVDNVREQYQQLFRELNAQNMALYNGD